MPPFEEAVEVRLPDPDPPTIDTHSWKITLSIQLRMVCGFSRSSSATSRTVRYVSTSGLALEQIDANLPSLSVSIKKKVA